MAAKRRWSLNIKFNLLLSSVLIGLFLLTALLTFRDQQETARKLALDEAQNVTRELITIFSHMSEIVDDEPNRNYALVPQVVATQIAKKISSAEQYTIRQVSLNYRNPDNRPDSYEAAQLKLFADSDRSEIYRVVQIDGQDKFRYMKALIADQSCLKCHGSYADAPEFIKQRFPAEHQSYNYRVGEVIGAVSVVKPMADLYGEVASSLQQEIWYRAGILFLVVLLTWLFVRQLVIAPVQAASTTIHRITSTGNLRERIPLQGSGDEIGSLLNDFNEMMSALDRTSLQRQEVEDRYRSLIEAAQSAIVTFLQNGKVVISNQQAEQLIGLTRSELLGETFFDYLEDSDKLRVKVAELARNGEREEQYEAENFCLQDVRGQRKDIEITLVLASVVEDRPMFTAILRPQEDIAAGKD